MRAVSIVEVAREGLWGPLEAALGEEAFGEVLSPTQRIVTEAFDRAVPALRQAGIRVLVRHARRTEAEIAQARADLSRIVEALPPRTREVLGRAMAHARDGVVLGSHVWDPLEEAPCVRELHGAGLIRALPDDAEPYHGRYRLHDDLGDPPTRDYDFAEASMDETEDLSSARPGPVDLLHDAAALAAAIRRTEPRRTLKGELDQASIKRLAQRLGIAAEAVSGPRWSRALRGLDLLGAVRTEPIQRTLHVEPGLETLLLGSTADAVDRLVRRLVDADLQPVLPAIRSALAQAEDGAVDEMIFLELVAEQHRDIVFAPWRREGRTVYPEPAGDRLPWSDDAFELVEARLIRETLRTLDRLGLVRRAQGVFAPTDDGLLWATRTDPPAPPVWLQSDLEALVPPHAITPWERYQLEQIGCCIGRDVVDRIRLDREGLEAWLATHELHEALALLERRSPTVPATVRETLTEWHRAATAYVVTRGVLIR